MKIKNISNENRLVWDRGGQVHNVPSQQSIELDNPNYDKRVFEEVNIREVETGAVKPRRNKTKEDNKYGK